MSKIKYKKGDIIQLTKEISTQNGQHVQKGESRPYIIIQNDIGNKFSPTLIVVPITKIHKNNNMPTHVEITKAKYNLSYDSIILCECIHTIGKELIDYKMDKLDSEDIIRLNNGLKASLGIKI